MYIDFKMAAIISKALDLYYRSCDAIVEDYRYDYQFDESYDFDLYMRSQRDRNTMLNNDLYAFRWFLDHADTGVILDNPPVLVSDDEEDK